MKPKDPMREKKIMDVTINIVHEKGLVGVKMAEIAKQADISQSNLYIYFKNKEDLLTNIFFKIALQLSKTLIMNGSLGQPFKKRFNRFFKTMIKTKISKSKEFSFFRQFVQSPFFKKEFHMLLDSRGEAFFGFYIQGQKEGVVKSEVDLELAIALIDGMTDKLIEFHNVGKIQLNEKVIDTSFSLVWDALRQ